MSELPSKLEVAAELVCDRPRTWLVVFSLLLALQINPWWWPGPDAGHYLSVARSIAHGQGLKAFGEPEIVKTGYPLLISPAFLVAERPFLILSVIHWLLAVALMLGVYRWARRLAGPEALLLAGLVVFNASFGMHNRLTLSETPFMAAAIWAVIAVHEALAPRRVGGAIGWGLLGGLLLAITVSIRFLGMVLVPGVVLAALLHARRERVPWGRAALVSVLACAPGALALLAVVWHDCTEAGRAAWPGATYLQPLLHSLGDRGLPDILEGIRLRVNDCGRLLIPGMVKAYDRPPRWLGINTLLYVPVAVAVLTGWWRLTRRRVDVLALAAPFYGLILVLWPFDQAERFGLPMLPLMWLSVWMLPGCDIEPDVGQGPSPQARRHRLAILAVLLVLHLAVATGYWIKGAVVVRKLNQTWAELETIAAPVLAHPGPIVEWRLSPEQELMLRFLIDLRIGQPKEIAAISANARWVVLGQQAQVPGFLVRARAGRTTLLERAQRQDVPDGFR